MRATEGAMSYNDIMKMPTRAYKAILAELADEAHEAELERRRRDAERDFEQQSRSW